MLGATWQVAQLTSEAHRRLVEDASDQFKEAACRLAQAMQQTSEDVLMLMPLPRPMGEGLEEVHQALGEIAGRVTHANFRAIGEMFRLAHPGAAIALQQQLMRDRFGALVEGQAVLLRAAHRATEDVLQSIEEQIGRRFHE